MVTEIYGIRDICLKKTGIWEIKTNPPSPNGASTLNPLLSKVHKLSYLGQFAAQTIYN